ncbi:uncharacterized protein B0I36DRAFT_336887 [Microdochium trichocladiopsis]|uniref:MYB DNA-binding domain-containing protein n=1 Tax=Microdochium trichocladiopsis TaxID=1682393 RepID=A0A9P8XW26_9PEZI|nr:uncharacterized protein B0I36DRAFT_336887 [Microdochium trichocladiopsis]KAH7016146.1 hypothetical protein B0I36DRAFT_336887 [Microdochium trichocladiopsis]
MPPQSSASQSSASQSSASPAKKQSKWSAEEDALIIDLRGSGMKWEDISKRLPGRSAISCRLHYQNYLERRSEWDEERKNKLARLYERFKQEMWAKVAEDMAIPWRVAEAMHWQLGEVDMAKRAGVTPFCLSAVNGEGQAGKPRASASRGHHHSHSHSHPLSHPHSTFSRDVMGHGTVSPKSFTVPSTQAQHPFTSNPHHPVQPEVYMPAPPKITKRPRSPELVMPAPAPRRRHQYHQDHTEYDDEAAVPRHMP